MYWTGVCVWYLDDFPKRLADCNDFLDDFFTLSNNSLSLEMSLDQRQTMNSGNDLLMQSALLCSLDLLK
jgi:hypothetical protein